MRITYTVVLLSEAELQKLVGLVTRVRMADTNAVVKSKRSRTKHLYAVAYFQHFRFSFVDEDNLGWLSSFPSICIHFLA